MKSQKETIVIRKNYGRNDLLSSFSYRLNETRVTGFLGYIISLSPTNLLSLFQLTNQRIISIHLEKALETQRCDLILECDDAEYIIEAKLFYESPVQQLLKQKAEYKKLTKKPIKLIGITNNKFLKSDQVLLLNWTQIYNSLDDNNFKCNMLLQELKMHLINNGLVKNETPDVYARELGGEDSLKRFLKTQSYYCDYYKNSKIEQCKYFAPHFGKNITRLSSGINYGISYVAKIYRVEYVESKADYKKLLLSHKKKHKLSISTKEISELVDKVTHDFATPKIIILLERPHLLFNPPIPKEKLQGGVGWLSKQYYTFEELFNAANL